MGSSGYRSSNRPSIPLDELQAYAAEKTAQVEYEAEANEVIDDALKEFNDRDTEGIHEHLDVISDALSSLVDEDGDIQMLFGGSTSKHTYVNGLSDVDTLVCLNDTSLADKSPNEVINIFAKTLQERLPRTKISVGDLAVTIKFTDGHEVQLLPAVRTAQGFRIASPGENKWSNVVAPDRFATKLTQVNQKLSNKVIPTIKLVKSINEKFPKQSRLSGYHLESLAIETFENYSGPRTVYDMVKHFFKEAQTRVLSPIADSTGQSLHVDDYLGSKGSQQRSKVANVIENIVGRIERAESTRNVGMWKEIVEL
jgi:hypothetical protein